jgi:hypothetical protein
VLIAGPKFILFALKIGGYRLTFLKIMIRYMSIELKTEGEGFFSASQRKIG